MIKQRRHPWPGPEKTALDRSRTIARSLLAALEKTDPDAARRHVEMANRFGELWLVPALDASGGERRLSVEESAQLTGRRPATIRGWIHRQELVRHPDGIDENELLALIARKTNPTKESTNR